MSILQIAVSSSLPLSLSLQSSAVRMSQASQFRGQRNAMLSYHLCPKTLAQNERMVEVCNTTVKPDQKHTRIRVVYACTINGGMQRQTTFML